MKALRCAVLVDLYVLLSVRWVLEMLEEWLSVRQRPLERVLIGLYLVSGICSDGARWNVFFVAVVALSLWHRHSFPDAKRRTYLMELGEIFARVTVLMGIGSLAVVLWVCNGIRGNVAFFIYQGAYVSIVYMVALPETDESQRGRRRKEAFEKLREFGSGILPRPVMGEACAKGRAW